ncbi:MAG: PepSY domain-containing protein [Proteobacteria bacterium]|nr:MAG: PepSY domain-containing protein [Pseudomonadota bacterium]
MKSSTLRTFIAVHTWVGLVAGFCLFIAFYAGALTLFHKQLRIWETSSSTTQAPESRARAQSLIDTVLAAHPRARDRFFLRLPSYEAPRMVLEWEEPVPGGGKDIEHHFSLRPDGTLEDAAPYSQLADFIYRLHYSAGFPPSWGIYLLGLVCVLYGLALASGVIVYAPTFFKDLFALRIGKNIKRMWQDAHNAIGILSLPFHLLYAWSSAILTLGVILLAPLQFMVFDGKLLALVEKDISVTQPTRPSGIPAPLRDTSALLADAGRAVPGIRIESLFYEHAGDAKGRVIVYGTVEGRTVLAQAAAVLDASSGTALRTVTPRDASPGTTFLRGLQRLHFGSFGGAAVQWTYFFLAMAGAFLFYSGNLLWIEARRKRRQHAQTRASRLMAQATLGVCLGSVAGISALLVLSKLAPSNLPVWEERGYYVVFFAALAWAFLRPPARAAHELLLVCAMVTAMIPLAQWARSGIDPLHALQRGDRVVASVALVALTFAILYWKMARAVLRRGRDGDPYSVWSLRSVHATADQQ